MTRSTLFTIFFFAALLFLLSQLYAIFESFLSPIAWSIILALVFHPMYRHALRLTGERRGVAAALITAAVFLVVAIPMGLLSGVLAREGAALIAAATDFFESGGVMRTTTWLTNSAAGRLAGRFAPQLTSMQLDLTSLVQSGVTSVGNTLVGYMGGLAKNVANVLIDLFIVLFTIFFLFRDGDRMYEGLRALIPMEPGDKDAVLTRTQEMLEAVVRGMVITAGLQGVLTGVGLVFAGVPYAAFLALLSACAALLPFGTFLVWLGCAIYLFAIGSIGSGLFLTAWGALVISSVDNFVRPIVIGNRARISTLLLFFGMVGGLEAYGFLGLFVGPALIATLAAFIEIYRQEYAEVFSRSAGPPPIGPSARDA